MKKNTIILFILVAVICIFASIMIFMQKTKSYEHEGIKHPVKQHKLRNEQLTTLSITEKLSVGAIGDILIHDTVYKDAFNGMNYDFHPIFDNIRNLLRSPDILTANQESLPGGIGLGVSSYPTFNSPHEVADAILDCGVDIVSMANNHTLDKGEKGIRSASEYLNQIGLPHVGSFLSEEDQKELRIIRYNGIKLAFLSYTYGTNGIPVPKDKDFLVNLINRDKMKKEIHRAKKEVDIVVMSIHWGNEYKRLPNLEQKELAQFLANEGVDIIFGSHPHVLQPMEWVQTKDGRKAFVVYSLGNFLSGQIHDYKDIGGMVSLEITKHITDEGKSITLSNPVFHPTYVSSQGFRDYHIVPLESAGAYGLANANAKFLEIQNHMTQWLR